jgi:hypothetical protein
MLARTWFRIAHRVGSGLSPAGDVTVTKAMVANACEGAEKTAWRRPKRPATPKKRPFRQIGYLGRTKIVVGAVLTNPAEGPKRKFFSVLPFAVPIIATRAKNVVSAMQVFHQEIVKDYRGGVG